MSIVAVGTVFPLVFAIGAAYSGRNQAVKALGGIKVCARTRTRACANKARPLSAHADTDELDGR
jgi:hypothetical protein